MSTHHTPVPWDFTPGDVINIWSWTTEHFHVQINAGENGPYNWAVHDLIQPDGDMPRFLAEGQTSTFGEAEDAVREQIGKTYPTRLGYDGYAGSLATTFTIATGERIDFGPMVGQETTISIRLPNGQTRTYVGFVHIHHHTLRLRSDKSGTLQINPAHITMVGSAYGAYVRGKALSANKGLLGYGRMYSGEWSPGCTGVMGYLPETVDHTGEPCPVHEQDAPHSLFR